MNREDVIQIIHEAVAAALGDLPRWTRREFGEKALDADTLVAYAQMTTLERLYDATGQP